jgi:hypothetical protein
LLSLLCSFLLFMCYSLIVGMLTGVLF